jgi:hypothetical protein
VPTVVLLRGAVPNPAVGSTASIDFELPRVMHVKLRIYDVRGRLVARLRDEVLGAGYYPERWSDAAVPSGVYFARLETPDGTQTRPFTLLR